MYDQLPVHSFKNYAEAAHLNKSLLLQFHNLEPVQFWNRFQWIQYSGMNIRMQWIDSLKHLLK